MSTNHTTNYGLCQWLATDQVQRTDFNADNAKIDAALADLENNKAALTDLEPLESSIQQITADLTKLTFGTYDGDNAETRTINLGFTPLAVLLFSEHGTAYVSGTYHYHWGGLALSGRPVTTANGNIPALEIVEGGFSVSYLQLSDNRVWIHTNNNGTTYHYIAFS